MSARLLRIDTSPRGGRSISRAATAAFEAAWREAHPGGSVDALDVWAEDLPPFDGAAMEAKYAALEGRARTPDEARAWAAMEALGARFAAASEIVLGVPMWNWGIPYRLKQLIDLVSQKDIVFRFDGAAFDGMWKGRRAVAVYVRGAPTMAGLEFQQSYLDAWLRFVGITAIENVVVDATLAGPDAVAAARADAITRARTLAGA